MIPAGVLANREKAEPSAGKLESLQLERLQAQVASGASFARLRASAPVAPPLSDAHREAGVQQVTDELRAAGVLDEQGVLSRKLAAEMSFEFTTTIPTPGVTVRGCLDECSVCEPAREESIKLELENQRLRNELLKKQITLLEQSQEYRCCPVGEAEPTPDA